MGYYNYGNQQLAKDTDEDENDFFYGGVINMQQDQPSEEKNKTIALIKQMNLFSISPKDKAQNSNKGYESSVYQTPELAPLLK